MSSDTPTRRCDELDRVGLRRLLCCFVEPQRAGELGDGLGRAAHDDDVAGDDLRCGVDAERARPLHADERDVRVVGEIEVEVASLPPDDRRRRPDP